MAIPTFTMRRLVESGVHFGHSTRRWNPKMAPYIYGERSGIHIIDLRQTMPMLYRAMEAVREVAAGGGRVLFVGTKRQASQKVAEAADRCGQYFVNHRWLGGMMTNWSTISNSIKRLKELDQRLSEDQVGLTKKELLGLTRERDKLHRALGGIKDMGGLPDILMVIDTNKEAIAVAEANKLHIPVVGVLDSNSDPAGIDYPVPGNDDAVRAIDLYCELVSGAVLAGIQEEIARSGGDLGEAEQTTDETLPTPDQDSAKDAAGEQAPAIEASFEEVTVKEAPIGATAAEEVTAEASEPAAKKSPAKEAAAAEEVTAEASEPAAKKGPAKKAAAVEKVTAEASEPAAKKSPVKKAPTEEATAEPKEAPVESEGAPPVEDSPAPIETSADKSEAETEAPVDKDAPSTTS